MINTVIKFRMKYSLVLMFLFSLFICRGQDTSYYDQNWKKAKTRSDASTYTVVSKMWSAHPSKDGTDMAMERIYYASGRLAEEKPYSHYSSALAEGETKEWFENGKIKAIINYKKGMLCGDVTTYWPNGKQRRNDKFGDDGNLISGDCFDSNGIKVPHSDFEKKAYFDFYNGDVYRYINEHIRYPRSAYNAGIGGYVKVSFVVAADGAVSHVRMVDGSGDRDVDSTVLDVFTLMPVWQPATQEGSPVRSANELKIKLTPGW